MPQSRKRRKQKAKLVSRQNADTNSSATARRDSNVRNEVAPKTIKTLVLEKLRDPVWQFVGVVVAILGVLVAVAQLSQSYFSVLNIPTSSTFATATALAFAPAKQGESLIIIADFSKQSGGKCEGVEPAQYVHEKLDEQVKKDNLGVRVERLHLVLNEQTAKSIGEIYSATLLLWGWCDSFNVKPMIERIKEAAITPQAGTERISIANPDRVEPVITGELPNQVSYLVFLTLGLEQYANSNFTETLRYLNTILAASAPDQIISINRSEVYYWRGTAYIGKGNYDQAIEDFNQAIKLKPDYIDAYINRGSAYAFKGNYDQAIEDYNQAIKLEPGYAITYYNRGVTYVGKGNYDRAIEDFTQAIKLKPDYIDAYINRGTAYIGKGNYDRAIEDFTQAIKFKPDDASAYNNRGSAYTFKGNYDRAIEDLTQAIKLKPDYVNAYNNRGTAYDLKGDYDREIEDYTQVIKFNPDDANAYRYRGLAYKAKKDQQRAIADFKKFLELNKNPYLRTQVTEQLKELGEQP